MAKKARRRNRNTTYAASVFPGKRRPVPPGLAVAVDRVERSLRLPVWLLVQRQPQSLTIQGEGVFDVMADEVELAFFKARRNLPSQPIALVVHSSGGDARSTYQIATMLRRCCGGFTAVVPRFAKSAATLLVLGADRIVMGADAELGPLDAQILDPEREEISSALDEVQALERLFAAALEALDDTMVLLQYRTEKKMHSLLPIALHFVSDTMAPLFEKIDTVHYTQQSRLLKVAEEYAFRLLLPNYKPDSARRIARHLVEHYTEHGFVIHADEARSFGLRIHSPNREQADAVEQLADEVHGVTFLGRLEEVKQSGKKGR